MRGPRVTTPTRHKGHAHPECGANHRAPCRTTLYLAAQASQMPAAALRRVSGLAHDRDGDDVTKGRLVVLAEAAEPGSRPGRRRGHGVIHGAGWRLREVLVDALLLLLGGPRCQAAASSLGCSFSSSPAAASASGPSLPASPPARSPSPSSFRGRAAAGRVDRGASPRRARRSERAAPPSADARAPVVTDAAARLAGRLGLQTRLAAERRGRGQICRQGLGRLRRGRRRGGSRGSNGRYRGAVVASR